MRKIIAIFFSLLLLVGIGITYYAITSDNKEIEEEMEIYDELDKKVLSYAKKNKNSENNNDDINDRKIEHNKLLEINKDYMAWLEMPDTNIDYPVVKSDRVPYYLNHTFDGKTAKLGTLISLKRSNYNSGRNIAIYGHNISKSKYSPMFTDLLKMKDKNYFDKHDTVYLYTFKGTRMFKVYMVKHFKNRDVDPSISDFKSDEEYQEFLNKISTGNILQVNEKYKPDKNSKIICLSTCDSTFVKKDGRLLLIATEIVP